MPDTRKKLIELLAGLQDYGIKLKPRLALPSLPCNEIIADHLIANGVVVANPETPTMQKWIPVTEQLPEEDIRVLVHIDVNSKWNTEVVLDTDRLHRNRWVRWGDAITHWMPLPSTEGLK